MSFSPTAYIGIESACGRFEITDPIRENTLTAKSPTLVIRERDTERLLVMLDDSEHLHKILKSIYYDFHTEEYFDLMVICTEHDFDFEECKRILKEMYVRAINLGMFTKKLEK